MTLNDTHTHTHSVGLLWTRDRPSQTTHNTKKERHPCPGRIRTRNPSKQTYALDRAATGIVGLGVLCVVKKELRM